MDSQKTGIELKSRCSKMDMIRKCKTMIKVVVKQKVLICCVFKDIIISESTLYSNTKYLFLKNSTMKLDNCMS